MNPEIKPETPVLKAYMYLVQLKSIPFESYYLEDTVYEWRN